MFCKIKGFLKKHTKVLSLSICIYNWLFCADYRRHRREITIGKGTILKGVSIEIFGKGNKIIIGDSCKIYSGRIVIRGHNNSLSIGSDCGISGVVFYMEENANTISIGKGCTMQNNTKVCAIEGTNIWIGNDCMFSDDIYLASGDGHSIVDELTRERENPSSDILIGDHVWIGTKAFICKGVVLGNNCIVGGQSVLAHKNEKKDNVLYAGNPAKIIRENINWLRERI